MKERFSEIIDLSLDISSAFNTSGLLALIALSRSVPPAFAILSSCLRPVGDKPPPYATVKVLTSAFEASILLTEASALSVENISPSPITIK